MKLKIEKDVPIPQEALIEYPLHELEVGESFVAPANGVSQQYTVKDKLVWIATKIPGKEFYYGYCSGGVRCWRIK